LGYNGVKIERMLMEGRRTMLTPENVGRETMEDSVKVKSNFGRVSVFGVIVVYVLCSGAFGQYGGGTGEVNDPYRIYTAAQMNTVG
jgi:hypothetical protein